LAVGGGAFALGTVPDRNGRIKACFVKKGENAADVRLLVKGTKCRRGEAKVGVVCNRSLTNCVVLASHGDGYPQASGGITQAGSTVEAGILPAATNTVAVATRSATSTAADRSFHIAAFC
jgi:hypothetical protein